MAKPAAPPYFFYGTLMDPDVLSWVTGQRIPATRLRPAWIDGHNLVMRSIRLPGGGRRDAMVYLGTERMEISDEVWDFRTWRRHHRASCLRRVRRWSASA